MENFANDYQTSLAAPIADGLATAISVVSGVGAPAPNFRIRVDDELMLVTSVGAGTNWTVQRGVESTSAVAHGAPALVTHVLTAASLSAVVTSLAGAAGAAAAAAAIAAGIAWSSILNTPSTLAGYGITDAYTKAQGDARYQALDSDLTAIAGLSAGGIPVQTAVGSWTQISVAGTSNRIAVTNGSGVGGNPTVDIDANYVGQSSITTVGTITSGAWNGTVGATTPNTGVFTTVGIGTAAVGSSVLKISLTHPSASTTPAVTGIDVTLPATATGACSGYFSTLRTAAASFTVSSLEHFRADSTVLGAGSAITTVYGFRARNTIAVGGTNYAYHTDMANAANTFAYFGSGSAESQLAGCFVVQNAGASRLFMIGCAGTHANAGVTLYGYQADVTAPSTNTGSLYLFRGVGRTTATAFTLGQLVYFFTDSPVVGAGSSITNVRGFYASNSIAVGATSTTGFYSDLAAAAGVRQINMTGTADCQFSGAIVMNNAPYISSLQTVTYSASMTAAAASGNDHVITANNGTAFTINAPSNPRTGQHITVTIRNTSGGALGVATWNAAFKMTAWTQPANGFSRTIEFRYDGTNWLEIDRAAADVPN